MTNVNQNPRTQSTANPATELAIRIGPDDGTRPVAADETEDFKLLQIARTAGGRSIDHAVFEVDLGKTGERLQDLETPTKWSRQVEVRLPDEDDPDLTAELLYWGEFTVQRLNLGRGESARAIAGVEKYHFGSPLVGYPAWDPTSLADDVDTVQRDPVFNPLIDGTIEGNRSTKTTAGGNGETLHRFIDPESARSTAARTYQGDGDDGEIIEAVGWTLAEAVEVVCQICNADEEFIKNPATEILADAIAPDNLRLRRGRYLPAYLDAILHPAGFDWFLALTVDADDLRQAEITIFEIGEGVRQGVKFQSVGEPLDLEKQNVADVEVETSIAELANLVRCFGSLKQFEVTVPLYRAWPVVGDLLAAGSLAKIVDGEINETYRNNPAAWREFLGNEAGDLIGLRPDSPTEPPEFSVDIGTTCIPARRPLGPTLTLDANGKRQKPWLEYSTDAGSSWKPWDESDPGLGRYLVFADQIGVRFDRDVPPATLVAAGDDARLRITGTITVDERLERFGSRRTASPNARDVEIVYDLSDRYHFRQVDQLSTFASTLYDPNTSEADEVDDTEPLTDWLQTMEDVHESAAINGTIHLHGIHVNYQIGDLIDKVDGRNISLNRNLAASATKKFLQLTGITFDYQRQATRLHVQAVEKR